MRRTELLQEIRKMRFDEAYQGWQARRLTQEEAAQLLGVHERTFRRYIDRFEDEGLAGLVDKRLEKNKRGHPPPEEPSGICLSQPGIWLRANKRGHPPSEYHHSKYPLNNRATTSPFICTDFNVSGEENG